MAYTIRFTRQAQKDVDELTPKLREKLRRILLDVVGIEPYSGKKLVGELGGSYSYRLSYKDRIVYSIDPANKIVHIERAKTHYGE